MVEKKSVNKPKKLTNREIQESLIENFVNLQRVLTNLTIKFDMLSDNVSRLLQIFEISAKNFIKKTEEGFPIEGDKELLKKLDTLLEQNKTMSKGITLLEEKIRHKLSGENNPEFPKISHFGAASEEKELRPKPLPRI